jgi:hypothetical protein
MEKYDRGEDGRKMHWKQSHNKNPDRYANALPVQYTQTN